MGYNLDSLPRGSTKNKREEGRENREWSGNDGKKRKEERDRKDGEGKERSKFLMKW